MINVHDRLSRLYYEDFTAWIDETIELISNGEFNSLDRKHLIEELAGLGNEQRNKVDAYLLQLLIYLLFYKYWESQREWSGRGWQLKIINFSTQLELLFKSKTLYNYFLQEIDYIYPKAVRLVVAQTDLPKNTFPEVCPFTAEQLIDYDFLPFVDE